MKKKIVLLILPALLALPACSNASISPKGSNLMAEDTFAHEEIFGVAEELKFERKSTRNLDKLTSDFVKIGYQIRFDDKNTVVTSDDTISIRYVAAIKDAGVTASWHRGLAQANSYMGAAPDGEHWKFKFDDGISNQSETKYTALNNGSSRIEAKEGEFADYSCFVIYTLTNIPYEEYNNAYLAAYVTLTEEGEGNESNTINSKGIAVKVERDGNASKNRFFFNPNETGHFLQGTINGVLRDGSNDSTNSLLFATELSSYDFYASYNDLSLKETDSFGAFYFSQSAFQFCGYSGLFDGSVDHFKASSSLAEYTSPKADGTYSLYVCNASKGSENENHLCSVKTAGDNQTFKLTSLPDWLGNDGCILFAKVHLSGGSTWEWVPVDFSGSTGTFTAPNNISEFLVARCQAGTTVPGEGGKGIYNKVDNIGVAYGRLLFNASNWVDW